MPADRGSATLRGYRDRDVAVALGEVRDPQDVPRLLAAVEAVLERHPESVTYKDGVPLLRPLFGSSPVAAS